ncbi:PaaI family thioesterase [Microbacterium sp. No. 7]|uniref:PaaI family thioesterase n=1 Tax=Microbacterium sp. No. 7 TaxID=1714373 RepID=UPI0006CFD903|nr:PaaI family thioesterase [Microbacterium sp. No. 7]ALJ21872.1 hypothetical protein AOA12_19010 [Microbacterium sp. No. 7]
MNSKERRECSVLTDASVERVFGVGPCDVTAHRWACAATVRPWMDGALPRVAVLLDHVLGEAVFARRPRGTWSITAELSVELAAPVPDGARIEAVVGDVVVDADGGFAWATVTGEDGRLVALGSTWVNVVPVGVEAEAALRAAGRDDATPPSSDRARPERAGGAAEVLGLVVAQGDGDAVVARLDDTGPWANLFGTLHGGVAATAAGIVAQRLRPGMRVSGLRVSYPRGVTAPSAVELVAETVHPGRRLVTARVRGRDAQGRLCFEAAVGLRA